MSYDLTYRQIELLTKIVSNFKPRVLIFKIRMRLFSDCQIEEIIDFLSNEFLMHGLRPDWEPNEYGLEVEELIDIVNQARLDRSDLRELKLLLTTSNS